MRYQFQDFLSILGCLLGLPSEITNVIRFLFLKPGNCEKRRLSIDSFASVGKFSTKMVELGSSPPVIPPSDGAIARPRRLDASFAFCSRTRFECFVGKVKIEKLPFARARSSLGA